MRKHVFVSSIMLLLALAVAHAASASAGDGSGRRSSGPVSLSGSWGFAVDVELGAVRENFVGVMVFGRGGTCKVEMDGNFAGVYPHGHASDSCSYAVADNGLGTLTLRFEGEETSVSFSFVVVADATELELVVTRPAGAVGSGTATMQ